MDGKSSTSAQFDRVDILGVDKLPKWSWAFNGVLGTAALLLPLSAVPESHIQAQTTNAASGAAAHVNFKIIIPRVLYLHVSDADTVAVISNSHNVALTATVRSTTGSVAARKTIVQDAVCAAPAGASRVICTVSMP
jgi:hypothetical protein